MFNSIFKERKLSDKIIFVEDLYMTLESGQTILILKGTKGDKIKEYIGWYETNVEIKLDKPIKISNGIINNVKVKKDFKVINNAS